MEVFLNIKGGTFPVKSHILASIFSFLVIVSFWFNVFANHLVIWAVHIVSIVFHTHLSTHINAIDFDISLIFKLFSPILYPS